jgi:oligopeptide/dipeptide ABC transporter ATP-binding protein
LLANRQVTATAEIPLLEARDLRKHFAVRGDILGRSSRVVKAVDGVSFAIAEGEIFGLAGESGCGKTTLGNLLLRLATPTGGTLVWQGRDVESLKPVERKQFRRGVQAVFQDPGSSLDSRMRAGQIVAEPLVLNEHLSSDELKTQVASLMQQVALSPAHVDRFPHQFSGGQRQRIAIARALILQPRLIVLDEPVAALDVSIRAQIINLLKDLRDQRGLAYFVISHDLATLRTLSDRIAIMYLGQIVETGTSRAFFSEPLHPYSQALLSATLPADPDAQSKRIVLQGEVPSAINPPSGCRFRTRCPYVMEVCHSVEPTLKIADGSHAVACHLY